LILDFWFAIGRASVQTSHFDSTRSKIANLKSQMSLPEISHRCPSCGAAVREADALFCPECGKPLQQDAEATPGSDSAESEAASSRVSSDPKDSETGASSAAKPSPSDDGQTNEPIEVPQPAPVIAKPENAERNAADPTSADAVAASQSSRRGDKTRERLHRASAVARGVVEGEVKRVEKIRHVSTTIVEEASYDPSLRFVLVAMGLFVVFVILLILSKVMG
jgi:hypothetical protein